MNRFEYAFLVAAVDLKTFEATTTPVNWNSKLWELLKEKPIGSKVKTGQPYVRYVKLTMEGEGLG